MFVADVLIDMRSEHWPCPPFRRTMRPSSASSDVAADRVLERLSDRSARAPAWPTRPAGRW
jgi:hypothetical protein